MSLPPLPEPADQMEGYYAPDEMHDFAKLAVREALTRAKARILAENYWLRNTTRVKTSHDCAKTIDAIIKEYE